MKKSRLLSMVIALLLPIAAIADSYTSLWKQYDSARAKDHPQTVLKVLARIADKAGRERAYGHLLKSQMATADAMASLSADSLQPAVERLRQAEQAAVAGGDKVLAAVYQSALGSIYTGNTRLLDNGEAVGRDYFRKSMSFPDALAAAFSTGYEPFVVDGVSSKYYYDDMLHIIGMAAGDYRTMHDYYASHGKREAACLTALELVKKNRGANDVSRVKKSKYIMSLDSLVREYGDVVTCGEVAIQRYAYMENADDVTAEEKMNYINYALMKWGAWQRMNILRNAQRRLTLPSFHASLGGELALPGVARKVVVMSVNNVNELKLTVSRLDIDGTTELDPSLAKDYERLRKHIVQSEPVVTDSRRYVGLPAYKTVRDTMEIAPLSEGIYLVEMSTDNVSVPVERQLLRVCNVYPVVEALPDKKYRIAVLNATTGVAMPGATVDVFFETGKDGKEQKQTYTCDANGEVYVSYKAAQPTAYRVYTAGDTAFPRSQMSGRFYYYGSKATVSQAIIYTDRRVYRPGQTVHAAAIAYTYNNKEYRGAAERGKQMTITLRDANRKEVARQTVTTDEWGMASADFVLPQGGLTGVYTLKSDFGNSVYANFSVEEYKRPTFSVVLEKAKDKYAAGDTVLLKGVAKSFAGVPVQGAKVAVSVVRRPSMFWRSFGGDIRQETIANDTVITSADGAFVVRVPMVMPETYDENPRRYYNFDVSADVTDASGETRHGEVSLPLSDHPTMFTCDVPEKTLADSLRTIAFNYRNNAGEPVDGEVTYLIDSNRYTCKANVPVKFDGKSLASARHSLVAYCGTDTLTTSFVTFTLNDRSTPVETHDWFYQSADRFPANGKPVYIQIGSSDSIQHVVYTLIAGDRIVEDGRYDLKNEVRMRAINYKPEWGDGITLSVAWVNRGQAYRHTARIERPLPDTNLNIKWTTFRDRLTPGQRETWTLNITDGNGKPARAQLLAMLYDKSLDGIRKHSVSFSLPAYTNVPWLSWNGVFNPSMYTYSEMPVKFLDEPGLGFSHFAGFDIMYGDNGNIFYGYSRAGSKVYNDMATLEESPVLGARPTVKANGLQAGEKLYVRGLHAVKKEAGAADGGADEADGSVKSTDSQSLRENLNETAFFYPGLVSNDKGNVTMSFTLPESVTTWQFYGLAHDKDMNSGVISATTVASKTVMVQPNVPRFVRNGDSGVISARISNTSDKPVGGTARMSLVNPETGKEVYRKDVKFSLNGGETQSVDFGFDMAKVANDGLLVCKVTAQGHGFSDGEQHYLPVLPDKELVTNTVAFSQNGSGELNIDVEKLFPVKDKNNRLVVEYTNSPAWLMIQALPSMAESDGDNAMSLAAAYYANSIGSHILSQSPAIRQTMELWQKESGIAGASSLQSSLQKNEELKQLVLNETPWLLDADREIEQKRLLMGFFDESQLGYRLADNLSRLSRLQREDGSFSWWKGMAGSPSMTMAVLQTLVRLNRMVGDRAETSDMIKAAFAYMDKVMDKEVKNMRQLEKKGEKDIRPSQLAVQYLYSATIANRAMESAVKHNFDYLVGSLAKQNTAFSIYGKAVGAVVLAKNGHRAEASDLLESIRQYTVYKEEMGRYFDTDKAVYSWFDYRIPSQVAAIEAMKALCPDDVKTISEMQRWLLQEKRTQMWNTPLNSVDAVYAFLDGEESKLSDGNQQPAVLKVNGQKLSAPKATAGLGYVKVSKTGDNFRSFVAEKTSDGISWGAVYAQFMQARAEVADASTGMKVEREVMKDSSRLAGNARLDVGDRVTVRITVTADRDYDFVQLSDHRAACLEPVGQISGYGNGYYCAPKDNVTNYYFDRLSKGKHVIETAYYIDRQGVYQTGTCKIQCAYSPEFMARTKAVTLKVEK